MADHRNVASEVVVLLGAPAESERGSAVGRELAAVLGVPLRTVHVEEAPDDLVGTLVDRLRDTSLAVMESSHATRWSGKHSTAEHVLDRWGGLAALVGPGVGEDSVAAAGGPVLVALDGSPVSERAIPFAAGLAEARGVDLVGIRVVAPPNASPGAMARTEATDYLHDVLPNDAGGHLVVESVDPIAAIVGEVAARNCCLVVVGSKGDRSTRRASMSRVVSGLLSEAGVVVVAVGPNAAPVEP